MSEKKSDSDIAKEIAAHIGIKIESDLGEMRKRLDKNEVNTDDCLLYLQGVNMALYQLVLLLYLLPPQLPKDAFAVVLKAIEDDMTQDPELLKDKSLIDGYSKFLGRFRQSVETSTITLPPERSE